MSILGAEYYIRSTKGPPSIYWRCLGCEATAKSIFGFTPGAGVFERADPHNPGCPSLQQEADNNAGLEEPLEEEAPMEPPIAAVRRSKYAWAFLGCSLVYLANFIFNNYFKIENNKCYIIYLNCE